MLTFLLLQATNQLGNPQQDEYKVSVLHVQATKHIERVCCWL